MNEIIIDNRTILLAALAYFPVAYIAGIPPETMAWNIGFAICMFFAGAVAFASGLMGGATAKLYAAAALWLGPTSAFWVLLIASILLTAVAAFLYLRFHPAKENAHVPHAYILFGTFAAIFPWSEIAGAFLI